MQQFVELEWLGDEVRRAVFEGIDSVLDGSVTGHDDGDDAWVALERGFDDLLAVDARKPKIGDQDVEGKVVEQLECALAGVGLGDFKALFQKAFRDDVAERGFVVYEKEMRQAPIFWRSAYSRTSNARIRRAALNPPTARADTSSRRQKVDGAPDGQHHEGV